MKKKEAIDTLARSIFCHTSDFATDRVLYESSLDDLYAVITLSFSGCKCKAFWIDRALEISKLSIGHLKKEFQINLGMGLKIKDFPFLKEAEQEHRDFLGDVSRLLTKEVKRFPGLNPTLEKTHAQLKELDTLLNLVNT